MRKLNLHLQAWLVASVLCALAACSSKHEAELQWARAALERNPQVKVLGVDTEQNTIKLRIVATGEVTSVAAGELAAIPIGDLMALNVAASNSAKQAMAQSTPAAPASEPVASAPIAAVEAPAPVETITATAQSSTPPAEPMSSYKVEREAGRVRVNGPGVSIESSSKDGATARNENRNHDEPIVCDGHRFMHLDGRHLNVEGDGIIARGGCELHITNTTLAASGTGITVLDATVHITNSDIRGDSSSLTTSSAAHVFLRNNTFSGLARRNPQAEVKELGGNTWR